MINYSSSCLFRTKCKRCFQPISRWTIYSQVDLGEEDFIKSLRETSEMFDLYVSSPSIMDFFLQYRKDHSVTINTFSFFDTAAKSIKYNRRKALTKVPANTKEVPALCKCMCGRSYWLTYDLNINIKPEHNRKCRYSLNLKK